jgi:hypothetical protein
MTTRVHACREDDGRVSIVALAVADQPVPEVASVTGTCGDCGRAIWLAKADVAMWLFIATGSSTYCRTCALARGMRPEAAVTSDAAIELARSAGESRHRPVN